MWNFVDNAKRLLWELVELGFLVLLALLLIGLLLGQNAGGYVTENVSKFAASASSGLIGIVILLAIIFLVMQRRAKA